MADKHASEACARKGVGVQLSPLAQNIVKLSRQLNLMERWLSGPKRRVANPLSSNARAGSNPALSASWEMSLFRKAERQKRAFLERKRRPEF